MSFIPRYQSQLLIIVLGVGPRKSSLTHDHCLFTIEIFYDLNYTRLMIVIYPLTISMKKDQSSETYSCPSRQGIYNFVMKTYGPLSFLQQPAASPSSLSRETCPHFHLHFLQTHFNPPITSPNGLSPSDFPTEI